MSKRLTVVSAAAMTFACLGGARAGLAMEWVTVGDPGNVPDTRYATPGYGAVDYVYNIARHEVTNAQYSRFLNAVAADDPNNLYNTEMGSGYGGITRSGAPGSYTYSPIVGRGNLPVNWVSWYHAIRFANWMHNGQPTGAQDPSTTEDGAYDLSLGPSVVRKPGARVFLPSEDEWYKAAYYQGGGAEAGYWGYPTQSHFPPTAEAPPGADLVNGSANYGYVAGDLTYVGSYTAKPFASAYGTYDQAGNVWEWHEALMGSERGRRGGCFSNYFVQHMHAVHRNSSEPTEERNDIGFRVAGLPVLDGDGDVDLEDFALFQAVFTGPR